MQQMVELRKELDPNGGRVMGARDGALDNRSLSTLQEYFGVMMPQDRRLDAQTDPGAIFRGYSMERRDRAPVVETEDFREEAGAADSGTIFRRRISASRKARTTPRI